MRVKKKVRFLSIVDKSTLVAKVKVQWTGSFIALLALDYVSNVAEHN